MMAPTAVIGLEANTCGDEGESHTIGMVVQRSKSKPSHCYWAPGARSTIDDGTK